MSRIIAGIHAGRRLRVPQSGTRPTSDRVREALFSILAGRGAIEDAAVLDLFAGSGALGLEALSRGAASLTAVEFARPAVRILRGNAATLGETVTVRALPVAKFLRGEPIPYDLVFLDPPYDHDADETLAALARGWVAPGGVVVVERSARSADPVAVDGWQPWEKRTYGETTLWFSATSTQAP